MLPTILLAPEALNLLKDYCEKEYPNEACGLLTGSLSDQTAETKRVQDIVPLENVLLREGRGRFDFAFLPEDFARQERAAEAAGFDVIGLFHSHPDHPPRPSKTDEGQPMLSGWVNVIASVHGGTFKEAKAWWRDEDARPFSEVLLTVAP